MGGVPILYVLTVCVRGWCSLKMLKSARWKRTKLLALPATECVCNSSIIFPSGVEGKIAKFTLGAPKDTAHG